MSRYLTITSADVKAARKAQGHNQTQLASLAGVSRCTVSYWENKQGLLKVSGGLNLIRRELGLLEGLLPLNTRARGWGLIDYQQERINRQAQRERERFIKYAANLRVPCLARTRKGHPCKLMSEAGRKRCKYHGGMSTGPRTIKGKARIAEAQKIRWKRYRDNHPFIAQS